MGFLDELQHLKNELRREWVNYYETHREFLEELEIDQGESWYATEGERKDWTLPKSEVIISVLLALRPDLKKELQFFAETINSRDLLNHIVHSLDLSFDIKSELDEQHQAQK